MTIPVESSLGGSQSILVVAPTMVLVVAFILLLTDVSLHLFTPWLRLRLTTTPEQRTALRQHQARINALRVQSNQLNSPATFAEYAKVQRLLQKELKAQQQLQLAVGITPPGMGGSVLPTPNSMIHTAQQFALSYGIKFIVYAICFFACVGNTLFIVPVSGWLSPLTYTPLRLILGEVGIIPWLVVCSFMSTAVKTWL